MNLNESQIKEKIEEITEKIKADDDLLENFKKDPVKTLEKLLGIDLPDEAIEKLIDGNGRILLRQSGTEPVIRVMVEYEDREKCIEYADGVVDVIVKGGHSFE